MNVPCGTSNTILVLREYSNSELDFSKKVSIYKKD